MKKIYHLATCDNNKRILRALNLPKYFIKQNLKTNPISETELEELYHFSKSYEVLINKRSRLYNERNLKNKNIKEADYKKLLLEHYTFLKRPILINEQEVFIGNSKKVVAAAKKSL